MKKTVVYITNQSPTGRGEPFAAPEMIEHIKRGLPVLIIPRSKKPIVPSETSDFLLPHSMITPLISVNILLKGMVVAPFHIGTTLRLLKLFWSQRSSYSDFFKNVAMLPKALFLVNDVDWSSVAHIHAFWSSTPATLAMALSKLTEVPWSFTAHRGDIALNNLLTEKLKTAQYARAISLASRKMLLGRTSEKYNSKIHVVHLGVKLPKARYKSKTNLPFTLATPAMFRPVKGHQYIVEACQILVEKGISDFRWFLYGYGEIKDEIVQRVQHNQLSNWICIQDFLPHEKLLEKYRNFEIDCVVLPSILTEDGQHEGIPVSLMEGMAHYIPVISTNTGGISELLAPEAGILVAPKSGEALAEAVEHLMKNQDERSRYAFAGRHKIEEAFDISKTCREMRSLFGEYQPSM